MVFSIDISILSAILQRFHDWLASQKEITLIINYLKINNKNFLWQAAAKKMPQRNIAIHKAWTKLYSYYADLISMEQSYAC